MKRRLIVQDPTGRQLYKTSSVDLSDIPNADATAPLEAIIETECGGCGKWYETGRVPLPSWDDGDYAKYLEGTRA